MQKQAIVKRLTTAGRPAVDAGELDEPWSTVLYKVRPVASRAEAREALRRATEGLPGQGRLVQELMEMLPEDGGFLPYPTLEDLGEVLPAQVQREQRIHHARPIR